MMGIVDLTTLSCRQKQEINFYTSCLAAGVSGRILAQTQRLRLARNFKFFTDVNVNFGTDETSLFVKGQPMETATSWRAHIFRCCAHWR
jgi:hypothetical protein